MMATYSFHPNGRHAMKDCFDLMDRFGKTEDKKRDDKGKKKDNGDQQPKGKKDGFPQVNRKVNIIIEGNDSHETKRQQKLISQ